MDLSIVIPYRDTPGRSDIFSWVLARYQLLAPWAEIIIVDDQSEPFSRAGSKNKGLADARGRFVLFADADMIADADWIDEGIETLRADPFQWCVPKRCNLLNEEPSRRILKHYEPDTGTGFAFGETDYEWSGVTSVGGLVMAPKEGILEVGGYDERFLGWGWEDAAFAMALTTLWGPMHKTHEGWHLWHPKDKTWDAPQQAKTAPLFRRYEKAAENRDRMLKLIEEPGRNQL